MERQMGRRDKKRPRREGRRFFMLVVLAFVAACGLSDSKPDARREASITRPTIPVPPDAIVPPDGGKRATGTLPGSMEVTADGAAHYRIPLWVSPGRAGMQPELTLEYNSRGGNGHFGVGWSLAGASSEITRCRPMQAIDGFAKPITFTSSDPLCLDGQRLIHVSDGPRVSVYKTERDTFTQVAVSVIDDPLREIVAVQKDGRGLSFGGSEAYSVERRRIRRARS